VVTATLVQPSTTPDRGPIGTVSIVAERVLVSQGTVLKLSVSVEAGVAVVLTELAIKLINRSLVITRAVDHAEDIREILQITGLTCEQVLRKFLEPGVFAVVGGSGRGIELLRDAALLVDCFLEGILRAVDDVIGHILGGAELAKLNVAAALVLVAHGSRSVRPDTSSRVLKEAAESLVGSAVSRESLSDVDVVIAGLEVGMDDLVDSLLLLVAVAANAGVGGVGRVGRGRHCKKIDEGWASVFVG